MTTPASADASTVAVTCDCGKRYRVPATLAGREASCNSCGRKFRIPANAAAATTPSGASGGGAKSGTKATTCGVCQTAVQPTEASIACPSCGLLYHQECWTDNLGCATYGCDKVNALKTGPDISLPAHTLPTNPTAYGAYAPPGAGAGGYRPGYGPAATPQLAGESSPLDTLPIGYLLMAISVLAALCSCVMLGIPSLLVLLSSIAFLAIRPGQDTWPTIGALVLSLFGIFFGGVSTLFFLLL